MAIALDQAIVGSNSSGAATSLVITTSATVAAGARIVVFVHGSVSVSGVTDANGNTYAQDRAQANGDTCSIWSAHSASSLTSGSSITITYSASSNPCNANASSFTGVATSSALDQVNSRAPFNETSWSTSSITPTVANTVVVGYTRSGGGAAATSTPDAGWSELFDTGASSPRTGVYQVVSDTAARNPSGVWSVSQTGADQVGITVNYKEAVGGGGSGPTLRTVSSNLRW